MEEKEEQIKALRHARTHLHRATELLDQAGLHHIVQELWVITENVTQEQARLQAPGKGAIRNGD